jgi:hypothetical protein
MQHPRVAIVDYIISIDLYTVFLASLLHVITFLNLMLQCVVGVTVTAMLLHYLHVVPDTVVLRVASISSCC